MSKILRKAVQRPRLINYEGGGGALLRIKSNVAKFHEHSLLFVYICIPQVINAIKIPSASDGLVGFSKKKEI